MQIIHVSKTLHTHRLVLPYQAKQLIALINKDDYVKFDFNEIDTFTTSFWCKFINELRQNYTDDTIKTKIYDFKPNLKLFEQNKLELVIDSLKCKLNERECEEEID